MDKEYEKLDELLASLRRFWKNGKQPAIPGPKCIKEEVLEDYLDHLLPHPMIEALDSHLAECNVCFNRAMILKETKKEVPLEVPHHLTNRARDLVADTRFNCLELVLAFVKNTIHIVRNSGILLSPELVPDPVRGKSEGDLRKATDYVAVRKLFDNISVDVQVERINGSYKLMINSLDLDTGQPPSHMKLVLFAMDRELNSIDDSEAVFYIKLKNYIVKIINDGQDLGNIRLDLRQEEQKNIQ